MKKLLLSLVNFTICGITMAQLPVSTSAENKKVILEELTGIHCQYCPDGHLRADQMVAAHPGNAFVINVHVGSYSTPGTGEPDFRTSFGSLLANQTALTGYPAGTINRHNWGHSQSASGTAESRSYWAGDANTVLSQPSYLNVALEGTIDISSRLLTVDVEVYYTGNGTAATNLLNVVLIQDSVMGPQTAGSTWYPAMVHDGAYQHNKILRHMLTGQWGDSITSTTAGTLIHRQYTYTIPTQMPLTITGTAIKTDILLQKCRVIAFVTESHQEIVSGNSGPVIVGDFTGVSSIAGINNTLSVYPNPNNGLFTATFTAATSDQYNVKVVNTLGQAVYEETLYYFIGRYSREINLSSFGKGIYTMIISGAGKKEMKKFVVD
jgi:hypothetical protein